MGLFRKQVVRPLTPLEVERQKILEEAARTPKGSKEYRDLLCDLKTVDDLIEREYARENPPKDKLSKADTAKLGMWAIGGFLTFFLETNGFNTGRSQTRRVLFPNFLPRFWGKDMDCEQKTQPRR